MTLHEYYLEDEREHFELMSFAVTTGYASAQKGRRIKMFQDKKEDKSSKITVEKKKADLDYLKGLF
jgi:hypothetical protein